MAFAAREVSVQDGQPIRLYLFKRGPFRWAYCSADRDITVNNQIYKGNCQVSDEGINFTGTSSVDTVTLTMPSSLEVPQLYRGVAPSQAVSLTIWDYHYGDSDYLVAWIGNIYNVKWTNDSTTEVTCQSLAASMDQPGLRYRWQRGCPYSLYDRSCKVDESLYAQRGLVSSLSGSTVVVASASDYPDGYFSGGYLEWDIGEGVFERRGIRVQAGTSLLLLGGTFGMSLGLNVTLYPGCPRTTTACDTKFNNIVNYGGIPTLPGTSPFAGDPIF